MSPRPARSRAPIAPRGYFGVAVWHPRHASNVGSLWRTAQTYEASFLATVGMRYQRQASDTGKAALSMPLLHHDTVDDLVEGLPHGCRLVGVELDERAVPLHEYVHPRSALYLLGAEDHGLPQQVLGRCHEVVQIPSPLPRSVNVAVAGSVVIVDRYRQHLARQQTLEVAS